jgi:hypothetical protein
MTIFFDEFRFAFRSSQVTVNGNAFCIVKRATAQVETGVDHG